MQGGSTVRVGPLLYSYVVVCINMQSVASRRAGGYVDITGRAGGAGCRQGVTSVTGWECRGGNLRHRPIVQAITRTVTCTGVQGAAPGGTQVHRATARAVAQEPGHRSQQVTDGVTDVTHKTVGDTCICCTPRNNKKSTNRRNHDNH